MKASRSIGNYTVLPARVLLVLYLGLTLVVCHDPFTITDDAERDLDRPLPGLGEVEGSAVPSYDTRPVWTWNGCEAEGTQVFRYRINGSEWTVTADLVPDGDGRYSYSPGDQDQDLYPGTYLFEVQERNAAGNWSVAASQSTRVLVQPPVIDEAPGAVAEDMAPFFAWSTVDPPQYGNGETGLYSWRLERQTGSGWEVIPEHSADDQPATEYQVAVELPDGTYRFGVAERNAGGERSAFFVAEGTGVGDYVEFSSYGNYRIFSVSEPVTAELSDGTNTYSVSLSRFVWEYRGPEPDTDPQLYRYHLWLYDSDSYEYTQDNEYSCESPENCDNAAGRLRQIPLTLESVYLHNVIFGSSPEGPTSEIEYSSNRFEFARLYLPGVGEQQDNNSAFRNTELNTTEPGMVTSVHIYAVYDILEPGPFGPTLEPLELVE